MFDRTLKSIWLVIGALIICWLGFVRVPQEWEAWGQRRDRANRPLPMQRERGVIVGDRAAKDAAEGVLRQGLRFSAIVDPALAVPRGKGTLREFRDDDWLLIPIVLATYTKPVTVSSDDAVKVRLGRADYTWKSGSFGGDYQSIRLHAVNLVFYMRDGGSERLLLDQPAWIQSVLLPKESSALYYYELAVSDSNGDDRIDRLDNLTLWSSNNDGTDLQLVWMPNGEVAPIRYREPKSGDLFFTVSDDSDGNGEIDEYDRVEMFRIAVGDTISKAVVSDATVAKIEEVVFGIRSQGE